MALVFVCSLCHTCVPMVSSYVSHLRLVHGSDPEFSIVCGIEDCEWQFTSFGAFNSHFYHAHRKHISGGPSSCTVACPSPPEPVDLNESAHRERFGEVEEPMVGDDDTQVQLHQLLDIDDFKQKKESAKFILRLKALKGISQVAVDVVIHGFQRIVAHAIARVKADMQERLAHGGVDYESVPDLDSFINSVQSPVD